MQSHRRSRLLNTSALGALALAVLWTAPAQAQLVQGASHAQSNGAAPVINTAGTVTDVTLGGARTVIDWNQFDLGSGDTANFIFANRSDIVLNRVGGAGSTINGNLNGTIGAGGTAGGNIWIYNANGVVIGANARISTGGLLVATAGLDRATDSSAGGFLDPTSTQFGFTGAASGSGITVQTGAQITSHGSAIALVAPMVTTEPGSSVSGLDGGNVLYGSAAKYKVSFRSTGTDDLDLLGFEVANGADGTEATDAITLGGITSGNRVFAALVSKAGVISTLLSTGSITATTAVTDETGAIVLSDNRNIVSGAASATILTDSGEGSVNAQGSISAPALSILSSRTLTLDAIVTAGTVDLNSTTGAISQNSGYITADTLSAEAFKGISLYAFQNRIDRLTGLRSNDASNSVSNAIAYYSSFGTEIVGDIVTSNEANLSAAFSGSGTVKAATYFLGGSGTLNLDSAGSLKSVAPNGNLTLNSNGDLTLGLAGNSSATGNTITLNAISGAIRQPFGGGLAGNIVANARDGIDLGRDNRFTSVSATSTGGGGINLKSTGNLAIAGDTSGGMTVDSGGGVTAGGALNLGSLYITAAGSIDLNRPVLNVGSYSALASTGSSIAITTDSVINIGGTVTAAIGSDVSLASNAGAINQTAGTISGRQIALSSSGAITQASGANLVAEVAVTATSDNDVLLAGANQFGSSQPMITAGSGSDVTIRALGGFNYNSYGTTVGTLRLISDTGSIGQSGGFNIIASELYAEANTSITLYGAYRNRIGKVLGLRSNDTSNPAGDTIGFYSDISTEIAGDVVTSGEANLSLNGSFSGSGTVKAGTYGIGGAGTLNLDDAGYVHYVFPVGGNLALNSNGDLVLALSGSTPNLGYLLTLNAPSGSILQNGGAGLVGSVVANAAGNVDLAGPNKFTGLSATSTGGGGLTINTSNSLAFAVHTAGAATITSGGDAIATGAAIDVGTLAVTAGGAINLDFTGGGVGAFGKVSAGLGSITIAMDGDMVLTDDVTTGGGEIALLISRTGSISQNAGTITADWIKLNAATTISQGSGTSLDSYALSLASGGNVSLGEANAFTSIYDLAVGGDLTLRNLGTLDLGPVMSGYYSSGGALTLTSDTRGISSTTAGVVTSRLTATAAGSISLDGTIASLGNVATSGNILLTTYNGVMDLTGNVTGQTVSLYADGGLTQSAGIIDAARLNVITNGNISLTQANAIDVVGRLNTDQFASGTGYDVTLHNTGAILLDYLVEAATGAVTLTSDNGGISQSGFSVITAGTLKADAVGDIVLGQVANNVAHLGAIRSSAGDVTYVDSDDFDITGQVRALGTLTLTAGGDVTTNGGLISAGGVVNVSASNANLIAVGNIQLGAIGTSGDFAIETDGGITLTGAINVATLDLAAGSGNITQLASSSVTATMLNASASGNVYFEQAANAVSNVVSNVGAITAGTNFTLFSKGSTNLTGAIAAGATGSVTLRVMGSITQTGGSITARSLFAAAGSTATLNSSTNDVDNLVNFQASNGTYRDADGFNVSGSTLVGNLSLVAGGSGAITQTSPIFSTMLNVTAGGAITLDNGGNGVSNLATLSAGGALLFANRDNFNLTGNITAANGDLTLRSTMGGINQTGGAITASGLSAYAAAGITLNRNTNNVATINEITVGTGDLTFRDADGFGIAGNIKAVGRNVSLSAGGSSGAISQTAGTISGQNVSLLDTSITQSGTARIVASTALTLTSPGNIILGGANDFGTLNLDRSGGAGTNLTLRNAGNLNLGNIAVSGGALNLVSDTGSVSVSGLVATSVAGGAGTSFSASGSFAQLGTISVTGPSGTLTLHTDTGLTLNGDLASAEVDLTATGGDITQSAGWVIGTKLSLAASGSITLGQNAFTQLGAVTAGGYFSAPAFYGLSPTNTIELTGNITVGTEMYLNTYNIIQTSGRISAASLELTAGGTISANGDNIVTGGTRFNGGNVTYRSVGDINLHISTVGTASITSTGAVRFGGVGDSRAGTISIDATGGISIANHGVNFTNLGTVINRTSGGIALTNNAALNLTGNVTAIGQTISLATTSGSLLQNAGVVTADTLNLSSGLQIKFSNSINNVAKLGVVNGPSEAIFRNSGDLELTGNITSYNTALVSDLGSISQTGGAITANYLFFEALNGNATAIGANHAAVYVTGNVGGGLTYNDTGALKIINITAPGHLTITAAGSIEQLGGFLTTADLDLASSTGTVRQNSGYIRATDIAIQAATGIDLNGANEIDGAVGLSTTAGDILFRNVGSIAIGGNAASIATPGALTLISDTGSITQSVAINASRFTGSAATGITLLAANHVDTINGLTNSGTGGIVFLNSGGDLELVGNVTAAGQNVRLGTDGAITQTGGAITANSLRADADTGIALTRATNDVGAITRLTNSTSGGIAYTDANGFNITGNISAAGQTLSLAMVNANSYVSQNGNSAITADTLNLSGGQTFSLRGYGGSGNHIAAIGNVSSAAELYTIGNVDLTGTIASPYFTLSAQGGDITQSGGRIDNSTVRGYYELRANNITLTNSSNQFGNLGGLISWSGTGNITAVSNGNTYFEYVSGGATSLTVTGGNLTSNAGGLDVNSLTASASGGISVGGRIGALGDVTAGADSAFRSTTSLALTGTIDVGNNVLGLSSGGAITQSGGTITTGRLNANAATSISIGAVNGTTLLADLTAGTDINLSVAGALDILGLTAPGTVTLVASDISQSAAINIGTLNATGQTIAFVDTANRIGTVGDITASGSGPLNIADADGFDVAGNLDASGWITMSAWGIGSIRQTGGTITTAALLLSAGGDIAFDRANAIDQFSVYSAGGTAVTLRNGGNLTVAGINAPDALVTLTSNTGNITQAGGPGNQITASKLAATAATGIGLTGANDVDSIGSLTTPIGTIAFTATGALALEDDVTAPGSVTLSAGSLTQTGGIITASQLFAYTTGSALLGNANAVGPVSASTFQAGGDVTFRSINTILLNNTQADGTLSLISDNSGVTQTSAVRAARLDVQAAGNLHFAYDNNVTALGTLNVGGQINYQSISAYQLAGDIDADHVSLVSYNGSITQTSGRIAANSFETSAGAGLTLGGANDIGTIGVLNGNVGDVTFRNRGDIALPGVATGAGHSYTITSDDGAITQNGALTVGTLKLSAATGITLQNASNTIAALGDVINSTSGGFKFRNGPDIVLQGDILAAGQTVDFSTSGTVVQQSGGIAAGLVTAFGGSITLDGANQIAQLGVLNAYAGGITIATAGDIELTGTVTANGNFAITSGGSITSAGGGAAAIDAMSISGESTSSGDVHLYGQASYLDRLVGGNISFVSDGSLEVRLAQGTTVALTATGGGISQSAYQITAGTLTLAADGTIDLRNENMVDALGTVSTNGGLFFNNHASLALSGDITARDPIGVWLQIDDGTAITQAPTVGIHAARLDVSSYSDIALDGTNSVEAVKLSGNNVSYTTSGAILLGTSGVSSSIALTALGGGVAQNGVLGSYGTLSVKADGAITLGNANNIIRQVAGLNAVGDIVLRSTQSLNLTGDIAAAGQVVLLASDNAIGQASGVITAARLDANSGLDIDLRGENAVDAIGTLAATRSIYFRNVGDLVLAGNVFSDDANFYSTGGSIAQTTGSIFTQALGVYAADGVDLGGATNGFYLLSGASGGTGDVLVRTAAGPGLILAGDIDAAGHTVSLYASTISDNGTITAGTLKASAAAGNVDLGGVAHRIGTLGAISGTGDVKFRNALATDITGTISGSAVILTAPSITETGAGRIETGNLTILGDGDPASNYLLSGNNSVAALAFGGIAGAVSLRDDGDLVLGFAGGSIRTSGALSIVANGQVSQSGAIVTGTLSVAAQNGISLGDSGNQIGGFGALSTVAGDIDVGNANGIQLTDTVSTPDTLILNAFNGAVTQLRGAPAITAAHVAGFAGNGDFSLLGSQNAILGLGTVSGANVAVATTTALGIDGVVTTELFGHLSLKAGGDVVQGSSGKLVATYLDIDTAGAALLGSNANTIISLGNVRASSLDLLVDRSLSLSGLVQADSVSLTSSGAITDQGSDLNIGTLTVNAASFDMGITIAHLDALSANVTGNLNFATANSLLLDLDVGGQATVTTYGALTIGSTGVRATGPLLLVAYDTITSAYGIVTDSVLGIGAINGISLASISAGDDLLVFSNVGHVTVRNASVGGGGDINGDGNYVKIQGHGVTVGADDAASITTDNFFSIGAGSARDIQSSGDLAINLHSMTGSIAARSGVSNVAATVLTGDLALTTVQGYDVSLTANAGTVSVDNLIVAQDYVLTGHDFSAGALDLSNSFQVRDITVSDTGGNFAFSGRLSAGRDLIVNSAGTLAGGGSFGALGDLAINAANGIAANQVSAGHDVMLDGGAGDVSANLLLVQNDYTLRGAAFFGAALSPIGTKAGTWTMGTVSSIDLGGQAAEFANIAFTVGAIHNGTIRATARDLKLTGDNAYDLSQLEAASAIKIDLTGNLSVFQILAGGDIGYTGDSIDNGGSIAAGGSVNVLTDAYAALGWVSAAGDMDVTADNGNVAILQANLTGATGNLKLTALNGDVQLGADRALNITSDNVFTRAAGSTGTATLTGNGISVYLDGSADLTGLLGAAASVVVANGDLNIDSLTTHVGDVYAEAGDGALTVGTVQSAGAVGLYSTGGGVTVLNALSSGGATIIDSGGLVDISQASSVESGDYFEITGAGVLANTLVSHDALIVSAFDGGVTAERLTAGSALGVIASGDVRIGQADSQNVIAILGDTVVLRGASTPFGMSILAEGDITVGADTEMLIGGANTLALGNCGCGGASIVSNTGGVTLNLNNVTGGFAAIGAAVDRDVAVVVANGDLTIGDLAGYNITAKALDGVLDIANPVSSGGDYTLVANDFAGNALNPAALFAAGIQDIDITDLTGGLNIAGALRALGNIRVTAIGGALSTGAIISGGDITLTGTAIDAASATALDRIALTATNGITLGAASLIGTGANSLELITGGDIVLGAATAGGIGAGNSFSSAGSTRASTITTPGMVSINLHHAAAFGSISGDQGVAITLGTGDLTVDGITTSGDLDLAVGGGIAQGMAWSADTLSVSAGGNVLLREANALGSLGAVTVNGGDFALRTVGALPLTGAILADGKVDLYAGGAISQTNAATITASRFSGTANGAAVMLGAANQIDTLGDSDASSFLLNNERLLTIDGTVTGSGPVTIRALGGMTISANGSVVSGASGDAIVLASDGIFTNLAGAAALQTSSRWLIYSQAQGAPLGSTAANDFGKLAGRSFYGAAYDFTTGAFATTPGAGNRFVYAYRPVLTVTPDNLTVTYDGQIPVPTATITGLINGDAADAWSGNPLIAGANNRNVGTYTLTALQGSLASEMNYAIALGSGTLRIDPRALTAALIANNRIYDNTTDATGRLGLTGAVAGDVINVSGTLAFDNRNAGIGHVVTASGITLSGADSGNYMVNTNATDLADIFARAITATLTANDRIYNGTTSATGTVALNGVISGDTVGASASIAFESKNVGSRTATATALMLTGTDSGNYVITGTASDVAVIARLSATGTASADNRVYDGTTTTTGRITVNGILVGDTLSASAGYAFANANAGTGRAVTITGVTLGGADAGNYTLTLGSGPVLADILRRGVTATADNSGKILGQPDPVFTFSVPGGSLVAGDGFTGALTRAPGEQAGAYRIGQGSLALSANYDLTVLPASFVISFLSSGADATEILKSLQAGKGFSLGTNPSANLKGDGDEKVE